MEIQLVKQRHLALLLTLVCTFLSNHALGMLSHSVSDSLFSHSYFIVLDDDQQPQPLTDEEFFDKAAKVLFPVNKYELPVTTPLLQQLEQTILPQVNNDSLRLVSMVFRGAASPEGPLSVNQRLGEQRVRWMYDFVRSRIKVPFDDQHITVESDIEDYLSLCIMMKRADDADYDIVKQLCDQYLPNKDYAQLKTQLKRAKGGRLWTRLLREYFPELRAARFVIYLQRVHQAAPVEPVDTVSVVSPVEPDTIVIQPTVQPDTLQRRELLSVKSNLLFYGVYMPGYDRWCPIPNVAIEYYPLHGHFTFGASFDCPWWQDYDSHKYFQVRNYQLETRYYLRPGDMETNQPGRGAAFRGLYLQAYGHLGIFGICFDADRGWVGEGLGAGLGVGYVLPLTKKGHWRLEFQLQAGWFGCKYDPYKYENPINPAYHDDLYYYKWTQKPELFKKRQYRYNWLGPTRIGITLSYDLLYRRIQKKGASLKSYELQYPQYSQQSQQSQQSQPSQLSQESQNSQLSQESQNSQHSQDSQESQQSQNSQLSQERRTAP